MLCIRFKFKVKLSLVKPGLRLKLGLTKPVKVYTGLKILILEFKFDELYQGSLNYMRDTELFFAAATLQSLYVI
jgi:hypothetical protein